MVHTALGHRWTRDMIRETWGTTDLPQKPTRLLFSMGDDHDQCVTVMLPMVTCWWWWEEPGVTDDEYVMRSIKAEALIFGDIVQGSFVDSYRWWHGKWYCHCQDNFHRNLSYKAILGHHWISHNCPEVDLVVKSDDDFFVDIPLLRSHSRLNQNFNHLYHHHHQQAPSPVSWNCQWITMDSFLPVLCGTGAPCLCSGDPRGVSAHFRIFATFESWIYQNNVQVLDNFRQVADRGGLVAKLDDSYSRTWRKRILSHLLRRWFDNFCYPADHIIHHTWKWQVSGIS